MTTAAPPKDVQQTIEKVQKLIALAVSTDKEEARTAAVQAARIIHEQELICIPKADVDRAMKMVEGARALAKTAKEEGKKNLLLGLALGFVGGKKF